MPESYTLNRWPYILDPNPEPKAYTPKLWTLNPETLNHKP